MSLILSSAKYSGSSPARRMLAACRLRYSAANLSNSASSMGASEIAMSDQLDAAGADQRPDPPARERRALGRSRVAPAPVWTVGFGFRRMAHELHRGAGRQTAQHRFQVALGEPATDGKAHEALGAPHAPQWRAQTHRVERNVLGEAAGVACEGEQAGVEPLQRIAYGADAVRLRPLRDHARHAG